MNNLYKNRIELVIRELENGKWIDQEDGNKLRKINNLRSPLGVVCEVYNQLTNKGKWEDDCMFDTNGDRREYTLSVEIRDYFGLGGYGTDVYIDGKRIRSLSFKEAANEFRKIIDKE